MTGCKIPKMLLRRCSICRCMSVGDNLEEAQRGGRTIHGIDLKMYECVCISVDACMWCVMYVCRYVGM